MDVHKLYRVKLMMHYAFICCSSKELIFFPLETEWHITHENNLGYIGVSCEDVCYEVFPLSYRHGNRERHIQLPLRTGNCMCRSSQASIPLTTQAGIHHISISEP